MKIEEPYLKCPWNNFSYCYRNECPFYGLLYETTTNDDETSTNKTEYYGCKRAQLGFEKDTYIYNGISTNNIPDACKNCSNHPLNGGSGICFCTLGTPKVTY